MICKRNIAVGAFIHLAALDAVHIGVIASAVEQKYRLLSSLQIILYLIGKRPAEIGTVAGFDLDLHIDKIHIGKYRLAVTLFISNSLYLPIDAKYALSRLGVADAKRSVAL